MKKADSQNALGNKAEGGKTSEFLQNDLKRKRLLDRKHITNFMEMIQQDKNAYQMFRDEAEKIGMVWSTPLKKQQSKLQHDYFNQYIKPTQLQREQQKAFQEQQHQIMIDQMTNSDSGYGSKTRIGDKKQSQTQFIPLSDLLKRNHGDRVQYHLNQLEKENINDSENNQSSNNRNLLSPDKNIKGQDALSPRLQNAGKQQIQLPSLTQQKTQREINKLQEKQGIVTSQLPQKTTFSGDFSNQKTLPQRQASQFINVKENKLSKTGAQIMGFQNESQSKESLNRNVTDKKSFNQLGKSTFGAGSLADKLNESKIFSQKGNDQQLLEGKQAMKHLISKDQAGINSKDQDLKEVKMGMDSSNRHENSEYSDEASNVSTDKNNKQSIKYKSKNNLIKPFNQSIQLDKKQIGQQFSKISKDKKITKQNLRDFLAKRYKKDLANHIVKILDSIFFSQNTNMGLDEQEYFGKVEKFIWQSREDLLKTAFQIYDCSNNLNAEKEKEKDKRISEQDLFSLISMITDVRNIKNHLKPEVDGKIYPLNDVNKTTEILALGAQKDDLFLDVLQDDFFKIACFINQHYDMAKKKGDITPKGGMKEKDKNKPKKGKSVKNKNSSNTPENSGDELSQERKRNIDKLAPLKSNQMETSGKMTAYNYLSMLKLEEDHNFAISFVEFQRIQFSNEYPMILRDLARQLTGVDILKGTKISELDELPNNYNQQDYCKESELGIYKMNKLTNNQYFYVMNAFRTFEKKEKKAQTKKDIEDLTQASANYQENQIYLEEKDFIENFKAVFGSECANECSYFGKLLYLYMADGYDRKKISLYRFIDSLYPLFDNDSRLHHNKIAFKILDIDRDNQLNIINLLDLQKNIPYNTILGQEIFKLIQYQIQINLNSKSLNARASQLNYDVFCKIVGKSCIINEIRDSIFGVYLDFDSTASMQKAKQISKFQSSQLSVGDTKTQQLTQKQIAEKDKFDEENMRRTSKSIFAKDPSIENNYQYYFKDLNMIMNSEASYGQRNFARNLDAMLAIVLTNSKQNLK